jgi:hypothetical protein
MALVVKDRVQESTSTTGTGSLTLTGAVSGFQTFASIGNGNTTLYSLINGTAWEVGIGTYSTTGPTLARTTVLSNSLGTTSPINLVGDSTVFVTYPAEQSVYLDASDNVSPLGTIASGIWQGSTIGVAYGGTGVTASSGANSVVLRDANQNVTFSNFISGFTAVTAAAGTTILTVASTRTQVLIGSTTQTIQLPNATTLQIGQSFIFVNNSSGVLTVTNNAGATIDTIPSGGAAQIGATSIATSAGSWGIYSFLPGSYNFSGPTADFGNASIVDAVWNGTAIGSAYGGTGLTTFTAANNAIYSTSASALTAGTLPVPAGGTGQISFAAGYIPYGNTSAALQSSNLLQFNGSYLQVGGGSVLGGATNPIVAFTQSANNFVQAYVYNANTGISASSDFVTYADNSTDTQGFADLGFTGSNYADPVYTVTGPNEAYVFGSARGGSGATGNLVYATDSTGTANSHQFYVGGFAQAKGAWKMQLTSTGLQLANALAVNYGGTGATTLTGYVKGSGTSALTASATIPTTDLSGSITNAQLANSAITINGTSTSLGGSINVGTVTSVTGTSPVASSGGSTPAISLESGYGDTQNPYASKTANFVLAAPNGSAGTPTFRAIVAADIPTLNQNTTGTASNVTGTVAVANGGTGATTLTGLVLGNGTSAMTTVAAPSGAVVGTTDSQTVTNKRVTPRIGTVVSASPITPTADTVDQYNVTALATTAVFAIPSGTPTDGQKLSIRIYAGTTQTISWTTTAGGYRVIGSTLPLSVPAGKTVYVGCVYNAQDLFWDVVAVATQA